MRSPSRPTLIAAIARRAADSTDPVLAWAARVGAAATAAVFAAGAVAFAAFCAVAAPVFQGDGSERFGGSVGPTLACVAMPCLVESAEHDAWAQRRGLAREAAMAEHVALAARLEETKTA